jgi:hypothetical protein
MKNTKTIAVCMLAASSLALAAETYQDVTIHKVEKVKEFPYIRDGHLYFGPDLFWVNQSPHIKGIHFKGHSMYYGLRLGYENFEPKAMYRGIDATYAFGRTRTDVTHEGEKLYKHTVSTSFANVEGRLGYNFYSTPHLYFSPFLGLGGYHTRPYHHLRYTEDWLYAALGFKMNYVFGPIFTAGLNFKGMKILYIDQHIHKGDFSGSHRNSSNAVGYGLELPLKWRFARASKWDFQFEPYYLKLNTQDNTNIAGARLLFCLNF